MIYKGYHYKVRDDAIVGTGKVEMWLAEDRPQAIEHALYTHRLHNGNAFASLAGVIHCPSCGQIAVVRDSLDTDGDA